MNSIQENLYKLLVEFDELCRKHDIDYLLAAGAGLGAVRNHRFLPWDDDIDLYITRENWNKLRRLVETHDDVLPEGRSLVYMENTPYYCNPIPRYVNTTTTTLYRSHVLPAKSCGQHLELFIFDPMPTGDEEKKEYLKLTRLYAELITPYFVTNKFTGLKDWKEHEELYNEYCDRIDREGEEAVIRELEEKLFNYPAEESDTYCMRWGIKVFKYDKRHFDKGEDGLFEGRYFPIGNNPEGILRVAYGDNWMYVPVPEEQISHNGIKYDDMPFEEFTKRYLPKINRESVFEKVKRNKRSLVRIYSKRIQIRSLVAEEKIIVGTKHVKEQLEGNEDYLRSLLEDKKYDEVLEKFSYYRSVQSINEGKYDLIVPISDRNLSTLLLALIEIGEYFTADKLLSTRKSRDEPLSDELAEIEEEINFSRQLSIARYDKKDEEMVQSLIDENISKYGDLLDIYRAELWIRDNNAKSVDDFSQIDEICNEALGKYPFDGEIMAIQARAKSELGYKDESDRLYRKSIENTRNGLIWQKVEDETGISRIEIEREIIEGI